jgi:hypothetical protein
MSTTQPHNRIRARAGATSESSRDLIRERPVPSVMAAFGLGLGVGVAAALLIRGPSAREREAGLTQRLGRQVLDAMASAVPDSIAKLGR